MDYEKLHKDTITKLQEMVNSGKITVETARGICADFVSESNDEKIRKALIYHYQGDGCICNNEYRIDYKDIRAWLEKQGNTAIEWNENTEGNKPQKNHSVLMKTTHGIAEGELRVDGSWLQYRWASNINDSDVLSWIELSGLEKHTDEIKPKFKAGDKIVSTKSNIPYYIVKVRDGYYLTDAGSFIMFNVQDNFELFNQNTAWNEEDEIIIEDAETWLDTLCDYLKDGSPECIPDVKDVINKLKSLKERIQSKREWSEENSPYYDDICEILINLLHSEIADINKNAVQKDLDWFISLKQKNNWKPSDKQMEALLYEVNAWDKDSVNGQNLKALYQGLKKLKGE